MAMSTKSSPNETVRDNGVDMRSARMLNACSLLACGFISIHSEPSEICTSKSSGMSRPTRFHCSSFGNRISLSAVPSGTSSKSVYRQVCVFQYFVTSKFVYLTSSMTMPTSMSGSSSSRYLQTSQALFEENPIFCRCPSFGSVGEVSIS